LWKRSQIPLVCGLLVRVAYGSAPRPLSPPTIPTVRSSRNFCSQWDIDKTRCRLTETADPTRSPLANGAGADGTPFARLKVAQLDLKVEAQHLSLDEIGSTMRDAPLNWPARVSGLIAAEISVDPHLLQP
jgi:hypothetical protein